MDPNNPANPNTPDQVPQPITPPAEPIQTNPWPNAPTPTPEVPHTVLTETPKFGISTKRGMSRKAKIVSGLAVFLLLCIGSTIGALYALAYHKIELTKYPEFQRNVEFFVMELPYTPKSARYILYKAATTQRDYSSESFDISAAVNTNSASPAILGLSGFDFAAKGNIDFKDPKNILFNLNLSMTKDFNMDLRGKEKMLYFKVNQVPAGILALVGLNVESLTPLLNTWVSYDTTPLETEARAALDETETEDETWDTDISKKLESYIDDTIREKIEVSKGDDGGIPVYKLHLAATPQMIDSITAKLNAEGSSTRDLYVDTTTTPKKPSDTIKDMVIDVWVDQENFATRKVSITFNYVPDAGITAGLMEESDVLGITDGIVPGAGSTMNVALVSKFSDFGAPVTVEVPEGTITYEEFATRLSEVMRSLYVQEGE